MSVLSSSSILVRGLLLFAVGGFAFSAVGCDGSGSSPSDPPSPPSSLEATSKEGAVRLSWNGPSGASGYNIYRDTSSTSEVSGSPVNGNAPVEPTAFTDESASNGTRYYYRVTAVGDGGESASSSEKSVRPFPPPPDDRP